MRQQQNKIMISRLHMTIVDYYYNCSTLSNICLSKYKYFPRSIFLFIKFTFSIRIIALQYCIDFYQISTWISHRFTRITSHLNIILTSLQIPTISFLLSPRLSSLRHTENSHWLSILHMVMYVSMLLSPYIPPSPFPP